MSNFRVDADHFRMIESGNESEHCTGRWQVNIASWFIWLCFERKLVVVALIDRVLAKEVECLAVPLKCIASILGRVDFGTLTSTPENVYVGSEFSAQIHRAHRFL